MAHEERSIPCEGCGKVIGFIVCGDTSVDLASAAWGDDKLQVLCWECSNRCADCGLPVGDGGIHRECG